MASSPSVSDEWNLAPVCVLQEKLNGPAGAVGALPLRRRFSLFSCSIADERITNVLISYAMDGFCYKNPACFMFCPCSTILADIACCFHVHKYLPRTLPLPYSVTGQRLGDSVENGGRCPVIATFSHWRVCSYCGVSILAGLLQSMHFFG